MRSMIGFIILILFNMLGTWLHSELNIPLPGNVIGLILFLCALWTNMISLHWVEKSAQFLLDHMLLFFIPYVVGIIVFFPIIGQYWLSMLVGIIGSTLAVLYVTGYVAKKTQKDIPLPEVSASHVAVEREGNVV